MPAVAAQDLEGVLQEIEEAVVGEDYAAATRLCRRGLLFHRKEPRLRVLLARSLMADGKPDPACRRRSDPG